MPIASDPAAVPLVGRDAPLNLLKMAAEAAFKDGAGAAVLAGGPGLGKTHLLGRLFDDLGSKARSVQVDCLSRPLAPLAAFRDLVAVAADALGRPPSEVAPDLARHFPHVEATPSEELAPAFERRRLFRATEAWLKKASHNRALLLGIDNFQWADPTSVALFRYLASHMAAPVMLVAATREPDLRAFWHPRIHRLSLGPLSEDDGQELVAALLGKGALSDHAFGGLWHRCGGNPGAFIEALRSLEDAGLIRQGKGGWVAPYQLQPRPWEEAILARIEKLDPVSKDLLHMLAVVERAAPDLLVRMSLLDPDVVAQKLDNLVRRGILATRRGQCELTPPYARELVYETIPAEVRQELHLAAGELLEGDERAQAHDLAYHFNRSQPRKAIGYLVSLGEESLAYGATEEAIAYLDQGISYMEVVGDPEDKGLLGACREALGTLLAEREPERAVTMLESVVGDLREAVSSRLSQSRTRTLKRLVSYLPTPLSGRIRQSLYSPKHLIPRNQSPEDRLITALRSLAVAEGARGDYDRAQDILDQISELTGKDAGANLAQVALSARFLAEAGFFPRATKQAEDALAELRRHRERESLPSQILEAELRFVIDLVAALQGKTSTLLEDATELLEEVGPSLGYSPELPRLIRLARQGRWRAMEEVELHHGEIWAGKPVSRWAIHARALCLFEARVPRIWEEAVAEAEKCADPISAWTVALIRAIEQAEAGDVQPLEDCVLVMRKTKSFLLTQALVALGEILLPQRGPTVLTRAKGIAIEAQLRATEAKFRNPTEEPATARLMAQVAIAEKDFKNAMGYYRTAVDKAEAAANPVHVGWGWLGRVTLSVKMGNYDYAKECLGKAREAFVSIEHRRGLAAVDELEMRVDPGNPVREVMDLRAAEEGSAEAGEDGEARLALAYAPPRERQVRADAVREAAISVLAAHDETGVLAAIAQVAVRATGGDRAICRTIGGTWVAWPEEAYEDLVPNSQALFEEARAAGESRLIQEVAGPDGPVRSALAVPVKIAGTVRAVAYVEAPPRWLEEQDAHLLAGILPYAACALDGAQMVMRIAESEALLEAIDGLGLAIGTPSGMDRTVGGLLRHLVGDVGAEEGWVLQGGTLVLAGYNAEGREQLDAGASREDVLARSEHRGELIRDVIDGSEAVMVAPIVADAYDLGAIYLRRAKAAFDAADEALVAAVAIRMASVIMIGHRIEQQRKRMADVETALILQRAGRASSITDGLTGLYTRDYFLDALEREFRVARRYGHSLTVATLMLDGLERFRQECGVESADEVFRQVCTTVNTKSREIDLVARIGGEVVGLMLPFTDQDGGLFVGERLRRSISALAFPSDAGGAITASIGLAEAHLTDPSGRVVLDKALAAMRRANKSGGNQVLRPSEDKAPPIFEVRQLRASRQETYIGMVETLCNLLEEKDRYVQVPAREVADLASVLGTALGVAGNDLEQLGLAARFCDVGKIGVPEQLLVKSDALSAADWRAMKNHPKLGFQILKSGNLHQVAEIVLYHHEHWDGTGYPSGLQGDNIPLLSRIVGVLHAFRSMMSDRPWRKALGLRKTLEELESGSGTTWDPTVVQALTKFLSKG